MNQLSKQKSISIWLLALGYFSFYVPYGALTKALSKGLFSDTGETISGFKMLPTVVIATAITLAIIAYIMGWNTHAGSRKILGINIPIPTNKWTIFSGVATAFIIMTTTLAYSFVGISIVFAALLMRGGVLLMAPVIDITYKRKVHWYSIAALVISLLALVLIFSEKGGYTLTLVAGLNIGFYLMGYVFRLQFMTKIAKDGDQETNYRFFAEEMYAAMYTILLVPAIFALLNVGTLGNDLYLGFVEFTQSSLAIPAMGIGILYACLYVFGSRIYLNHRENTFCIPINRCSSLLAGVVASLALGFITGDSFVSTTQLISAGLLITATMFLAYPAFATKFGWNHSTSEDRPYKSYLFVCPGNTSRSPMAEKLCRLRIDELLKSENIIARNIEVFSAGINPKVGRPLSKGATLALQEYNILSMDHESRELNKEMVGNASYIFCMDESHKKEVIRKFPSATLKIMCLDPNSSIPTPHGEDLKTYNLCAKKLDSLIKKAIENNIIKVA